MRSLRAAEERSQGFAGAFAWALACALVARATPAGAAAPPPDSSTAAPVGSEIRAEAAGPLAAVDDLSELSLEQLGNVPVTSVSRREESLAHAPASVFVLTSEDIRRSGAKTLPEVLRLVPTLQVDRADANQYAISARGFNSVLANKMLVLIDNRTVYSPLFSGVFWEAQDLMLEDVDRIEVISGPGGTSWGTNAVNGVINIITRGADETPGVVAAVGGGTDQRVGEMRFGWIGRPSVRVYAKVTDQDHSDLATGAPVDDASDRLQTGARLRWSGAVHTVLLDAGQMTNDIDQAVGGDRTVSGYHVLGRWTRAPVGGSEVQLQAYYERDRRLQPGAIFERLDTWDVDFHHALTIGRHGVVWGAGYRFQPDRVENLGAPGIALLPPNRDLRSADVFAEDAIHLLARLDFIAGARLEHNVWTGWEYLPTLRLAWQPAREHFVWAAASRAVRAPARIDREFFRPASPPHLVFDGGPDFASEILDEVEVGWRAQPRPAVSWSLASFAGRYDDLRSLELTPAGPQFANDIRGTMHGVEAWANWRVIAAWRLSAGGVLQRKALFVKAGATDFGGLGVATLGDDPDHWWTAKSSFDLGEHVELDLMARHSGALSQIPNYSTLDARVAARLSAFEASLTAANLVGPRHAEWGAAANHAEFGRSFFAQVELRR